MAFLNPTDSPDFQGGVGIGGGVLVDKIAGQAIGANTTINYGPFYVGMASGLIMSFQDAAAVMQVQLQWLDKAVGGTQLYSTVYSRQNTIPINDLITVGAPFLQVGIQNVGAAGSFFFFLGIAGAASGNLSGNFDKLLWSGSPSVPANSTTNVFPFAQVPGPATLTAGVATAPGHVEVDAIGEFNSTFQPIAYLFLDSTDPLKSVAFNIPLGDIRIRLSNSTAAAQSVIASIVSGR